MTEKKIRYGEFVSAVRRKQRVVSYNEIYRLEKESPRRGRIRLIDLHRLITPYVTLRFFDQIKAVMPLVLFLAGFQVLVLRVDLHGAGDIVFGLLAVMAGLMFFMEGVKQGLMPFAEHIGFRLPAKAGIAVVLGVALVLGALATIAEPAIGALQAAGQSLGSRAPPYLRLLLGERVNLLVMAVASAVGCAVAVGILRLNSGTPLKWLVVVTLIPAGVLTWLVGRQPELTSVLGLAWDCGAITTGPVTVPLVLAVGIGVAAASGRDNNPLSGFGIVTLASLFPAIFVMAVGLWLSTQITPGEALQVAAAPLESSVWSEPPLRDVIGALQAILPLVAFLYLVLRYLLREKMHQDNAIFFGIAIALLGMMLFNVGLSTGLIPLGDQAGATAPNAFIALPGSHDALYPYVLGVTLLLLFAFGLGYGATVAEPALNAMGITVENLSNGAFSRRTLVHAVAIGVGVGTALGVSKVVFGWSMMPMLLIGYGIALVLTLLSSEQFVNLGWDSAGVTTGPVTVPVIMSLGLGLASAVGASDGFGILAMASVGPIVSVLLLGLLLPYWTRFVQRG